MANTWNAFSGLKLKYDQNGVTKMMIIYINTHTICKGVMVVD